MGEDARAMDDCTEAISIDPKCANAYHNRACALREKGNAKQSLLDYNRAIELDSTNPKTFAQRASVYLMLHKYELCIEDANTALKLDPELLAVLYYRACAYANLKQFDHAVGDFNLLIADGAFMLSHFQRAICFIEMEMYKEALDDAQSIEDLFGRTTGLSEYCRACAYHAAGDLDKALAAFSEACNDLPKFKQAFEKRAAVYEQIGKLDLAKRDLETASKLEPGSQFNVTFENSRTVLL
jgi:tetratricopeptide (TPR) repeat protein